MSALPGRREGFILLQMVCYNIGNRSSFNFLQNEFIQGDLKTFCWRMTLLKFMANRLSFIILKFSGTKFSEYYLFCLCIWGTLSTLSIEYSYCLCLLLLLSFFPFYLFVAWTVLLPKRHFMQCNIVFYWFLTKFCCSDVTVLSNHKNPKRTLKVVAFFDKKFPWPLPLL